MSVGRNRIKEFGQESKRCQASSNIPKWRGSPMTDFSTSPRVRLLSITLVTLLVLSPLVAPLGVGPIGTASAADGVHYVTDSGFEVVDASDGAHPRSGNPFPDSDSDTLELPDITLSSSGAASVTLDQRTGTFTNLTDIDDDPSITVTPDDKQEIALLGGFDSLNVSDVIYGSSSSAVDFVYNTDSETTATIRFGSTGLDTGDTVEALDVDTGTTLDTATVDSDESISFSELDAGAHSVNLREEVTTGSSSSGGGGGGSGGSTATEDEEASVTVTEATETDDSSGDEGGEDGEQTPDTTVSVSNPQPGQTLVIENGQARIVDADTDPEGDTAHGADEDPGQADDADDGSDAGGSDDGAGNVRADRLSVDINTDQDFTLSVTTYESDLTRSSTAGQRSQPALAPPASGAVSAVDASILPRAEPPAPIAQIDAPETVRAAAESFEADTATVSAGYVDVEHTLGDGAIAGATFAFSIRRAYLDELGVAPEGVTLYHRLDGEWETRETEYTDSGGTYYRFEGTMPKFSVFALGTGAATIEPTAATVDAATIDAGAEATVTATVTNRGQTTAEDSIELTLDGDVVDTETVTLDGGASRNVTFTVAPVTPGEYDLAVGSIDLEALTVEEPGDDPEETDSSPPWGIIGIAVALVVVLALGVVALRRR